MLIATLVGPMGKFLIRKAKSRRQKLFSWTVNHEKAMDWCIRQELDGVITDDPAKFLDVCERYQEDDKPAWPLKVVIGLFQINIFALIFAVIFWKRHGFGLDTKTMQSKKRV